MVIYHKKHRDARNCLSEKMKRRLSKKEKRDACELDKNFDNNEMCDARLYKLSNLSNNDLLENVPLMTFLKQSIKK